MATRLVQMGCEACSMMSTDQSAEAADRVCAWGDAAKFDEAHCLQAARVAFSAFPKDRCEPLRRLASSATPLSGDDIVFWRLNKHSTEITKPLLQSPELAESLPRVSEATCEVVPD